MTDRALLSVEDVSVDLPTPRGNLRAVDHVDLTVGAGRTLGIVGESGCGKTMLSRAILQLLPKKAKLSGRVMFDGQDLVGLDPERLRKLRGRSLAVVFQDPMTSLNPVLTIGTQLIETLQEHLELDGTAAKKRSTELLAAVGIPAPEQRLTQYPHQLSGGMRQRVAIAIALSCEPKLLIADEPTTALDVTIQAQILDLLAREQRRRHMAMIIITHDLGVVAGRTDEVAVMYAGRVVERAPTPLLFKNMHMPYTRGAAGGDPEARCRPAYAVAGDLGASARSDPAAAGLLVRAALPLCRRAVSSREARAHARRNPRSTNLPASTRFWRRPGWAHDASHPAIAFARSAARGWKTSSSNMPSAARPFTRCPTSAWRWRAARRWGWSASPAAASPRSAARCCSCGGRNRGGCCSTARTSRRCTAMPCGRMRRRVQLIFQDPIASLNPRRRIGDIVAEPLVIAGVKDPDKRQELVHEVLSAVGLDPVLVMGRLPHEFSGGQCQRICIARALVLNPEFVICDEPVSALDVSIRAQILNLLEDMKARFGLTLLFIAHDLAVVKAVSDRVAVMYLGRLCEVGPSEQVFAHPAHPYTALLIEAIPVPDPDVRPAESVAVGEPPSPMSPPSGCRFRTRCPRADQRCSDEVPELREVAPRQFAACHHPLIAAG